MKKNLFYIGAIFLLLGCGASQKIQKPNVALDDMMDKKSFQIKIQKVEPFVTQALSQIANAGMLPPGNTVGSIDVTGSGYFIKVQGDSVSANLPYYGERRMSGGYNTDVGIIFDVATENLMVEKRDTGHGYTVKFNARGDSETYFITSNVTADLSSTISIQSSHRNQIRYRGGVETLEE